MMHYWNYGPGYYSLNSGFSIFGLILTVFFWSLVIMLIIKLVKSFSCHHHEEIDDVSGDRSLEIVRERFAKGEINKKEFEQLKKDLS